MFRNFSGLFRVRQFPLYLGKAEVLSPASNFAILLVLLTLKGCQNTSFSKQVDYSLTTSFGARIVPSWDLRSEKQAHGSGLKNETKDDTTQTLYPHKNKSFRSQGQAKIKERFGRAIGLLIWNTITSLNVVTPSPSTKQGLHAWANFV